MSENRSSSLFQVIRTRRSIRRYQDKPVPRELLAELFDAARWAPSAHNRQPWRFAVIEARETKQLLARAMGERLRADLERDGVPPEIIAADTGRSYARITSAPVVVIACVSLRDMDSYPDARRKKAEWMMASESLAMAVENLLLAAHACGLGACWLCAPLFVPDTVRQVLDLDSDWEPQALITLGFPAETKTKTRVPLESTVRYLDSDDDD